MEAARKRCFCSIMSTYPIGRSIAIAATEKFAEVQRKDIHDFFQSYVSSHRIR